MKTIALFMLFLFTKALFATNPAAVSSAEAMRNFSLQLRKELLALNLKTALIDKRGKILHVMLDRGSSFDDLRSLVAEEPINPTIALLDLAVAFGESLPQVEQQERSASLSENNTMMAVTLIGKINANFLVHELDASPTRAMSYAIFTLREGVVQWLLDNVMDVDFQEINVDAIMNVRAEEGLEIDAEAVARIKDMLQSISEEPQLDPTDRLYLAAENSDKEAAQAALEEGADFQRVIGMLLLSVKESTERAIKLLIDLLDAEAAQDSLNGILITFTLEVSNRERAELLISLGANANLALAAAIHHKKIKQANLMIELGADPLPIFALYRDNIEAIDFILDELNLTPEQRGIMGIIMDTWDLRTTDEQQTGLLDDIHTVLSTRDNHTSTVVASSTLPRAAEEVADKLIKAVYRNNTDSIANLLQAEELPVDVVIDDIGTTLLHHAASEGKLKTVTYLVKERGANPNITNSLNFTPLDVALFFRQQKVATFLLENDAISAEAQSESGVEGAPTL